VAEVEKDFDPELPDVPGFPGDISQVLLNIIVNSAHAIGAKTDGGSKGMGRITVRTCNLDDFVEIRIQDTGGGIPEEIQHRIFDPLFYHERKRERHRAGIGHRQQGCGEKAPG